MTFSIRNEWKAESGGLKQSRELICSTIFILLCMKEKRRDWSPSWSLVLQQKLCQVFMTSQTEIALRTLLWGAIKFCSSFLFSLTELVVYHTMQSGTTWGTDNKCIMWEPSWDARAQMLLGSARKLTLIILILSFVIDPYQYWYPQGAEAITHLFLWLILDVWCTKHTERKPTA